MRFERLRLLAFGHFTDVDIDLGESPALHILYGPNEAGKSTALRAITGLLYGIPVTTSDAHLHRMPDLRVGADLSHAGTSLAVLRRKGNINTLLDADSGEPLPETTLRGMLGGVDESTFRAMFGLDHVSLRQGAESLLSGGGSVGESLFDAGLSGRGIQQVLSELRKEADELYRPRGQRQAVNEALRRLKQARERLAGDSVRPDAWIQQVEELDRARADSRKASERRRSLVAEQNSLQRALRVLPMLAKRRGLLDRRSSLGDVVMLEPEALERRVRVQRRTEELGRDTLRLSREIDELESQLSSLDVPEPLARLDPALVEEVHGRLGEYRKALVDLPKRTVELKMREAEVQRLGAVVGLTATSADLERAQVGVRVHAAVRRLATRRAALDASVADLRRRLGEREAALEDLRARAQDHRLPPEGGALATALDGLRGVAELPARIEELDAERVVLEQRVADGVRALSPWQGDAADLERTVLPSSETLDRFAREMDALGGESKELARRRRELERKRAENRKEVRAQEAAGAPPTEHDLLVARARRDRLWSDIKQSDAPVLAGAAAALEESVSEADALADRLRREADRVASVAMLRANAESLDAEDAGVKREEAALAASAEALASRWQKLWEGVGFEPGDPAQMKDWLARSATTVDASARLRELEVEHGRYSARLAERRNLLLECMREAGVEIARDIALDALTRSARDLLEIWEALRLEQQRLTGSVASLEAELARERRALAEQDQQLTEWRQDWESSIGALGLSGDASTDEALAVLDGMVTLAGKVDEMESMRARVSAIELDIEAFRRDVAQLVSEASPDLVEREAADAAERLVRLHQRAVMDLDARERIDRALSDRRAELKRIDTERQSAEVELQSLFADAGVSDTAALQLAEERSAEASAIDLAAAEVERELLDAGEGADVEQLVAQTEGTDVDSARARLYELESEIEALTEEIDRLGREIGSKESSLATLQNETGAAAAAADEQESLADLAARVRRYVRVKLAAEILESEVERYRQQNQGPILGRANAYFPRLTLGNYRELRVGYDAKDAEVLRCVRDDGSEVEVEALSDGTRDQLYLALRLATLEHFAEGHDPLPLVLDDVFIHFDDDRAKAALGVLGSFAETTQILFFTHHARLLELAREVVPDDRRVEHDLSKLCRPRADFEDSGSRVED